MLTKHVGRSATGALAVRAALKTAKGRAFVSGRQRSLKGSRAHYFRGAQRPQRGVSPVPSQLSRAHRPKQERISEEITSSRDLSRERSVVHHELVAALRTYV